MRARERARPTREGSFSRPCEPPIDAGLLKATDRKTLAREVEDAIRTELLRLRSLA